MSRELVGLCTSVRRMANSHNGNPKWELTVAGGTARQLTTVRTKTDGSVGYDVCSSWEGRGVHLWLDGRGVAVAAESLGPGAPPPTHCESCGRASRSLRLLVIRSDELDHEEAWLCGRCAK